MNQSSIYNANIVVLHMHNFAFSRAPNYNMEYGINFNIYKQPCSINCALGNRFHSTAIFYFSEFRAQCACDRNIKKKQLQVPLFTHTNLLHLHSSITEGLKSVHLAIKALTTTIVPKQYSLIK